MRDEENLNEYEDLKTVTMDDMMSDEEKVLSELLYSAEPVTVRSVAEKTGMSVSNVGKIAATLVNSGYLLSDSRSPGLDEEASLVTDPIVSDLKKEVSTFRAADSKEEIENAIQKHREVITDLEEETGFESGGEFNNALFEEDESPAPSEENKDKAMKWILLEGQTETLKTVRDRYEEFERKNKMLEESFGFTPVSINPPSHDKREYLEPVVGFPPL